ncbi:MAG: hypothetical protein AB1656_09265 [Candidatus Omnitrophota bacterium]
MVRKAHHQNYPRINDEKNKYFGYLDETKLKKHIYKITSDELIRIINEGIHYANNKASRSILCIDDNFADDDLKKYLKKQGKELFSYFLKYFDDPASTAHACLKRHYKDVGKEQFRNRTLQKQRMNSGWRYQYIAKETASASKRFLSVSDLGSEEADFNATINMENQPEILNIYVSVKNRTNTMGGQDWPKAISALENVAIHDRNRQGPYLCVFGIVMEKGQRLIKTRQKSKIPHSMNTEVWKSDFFWPFFSNHSYEEIMNAVLEVLITFSSQDNWDIEVPNDLLESFGECCYECELLDKEGNFNDAFKLVGLFCHRWSKGK